MDDPLRMGRLEGVGQRQGELGRLARGEETIAAQAVGQAAAVHPLHDKEGQAVVLADFVDLDDVGVAKPRKRARLPAEPLASAAGKELDRDQALQPRLPRPVDDPHPTPPDLAPVGELRQVGRNRRLGGRLVPTAVETVSVHGRGQFRQAIEQDARGGPRHRAPMEHLGRGKVAREREKPHAARGRTVPGAPPVPPGQDPRRVESPIRRQPGRRSWRPFPGSSREDETSPGPDNGPG